MYLPPENAVSRTGEKELIIPNKIFIEPAAGIDQNGSAPPPPLFSLLTDLQYVFLLKT